MAHPISKNRPLFKNRQGLRPVLCIAGPTASGKSAAAIALAKAVDGEIVNADSMQVYSDLQIISARPRPEEMAGIPHHLFGHIDGATRYSTGQWLREAQEVLIDILARQKTPILVGGTGLYFKALTQGLAEVPEPGRPAMAVAENIYARGGIEALRQAAENADPVATAQVLGDDPQRLLRIVAVSIGTGEPLSQWQTQTRPILSGHDFYGVAIMPERDALYARINARFDAMIAEGGRAEALAVLARDLPDSLPVMKAIGLRELIDGSPAAMEAAKQASRRYAKRQYTWFRNQTPDWPKAESVEHTVQLLEDFFLNMTLT